MYWEGSVLLTANTLLNNSSIYLSKHIYRLAKNIKLVLTERYVVCVCWIYGWEDGAIKKVYVHISCRHFIFFVSIALRNKVEDISRRRRRRKGNLALRLCSRVSYLLNIILCISSTRFLCFQIWNSLPTSQCLQMKVYFNPLFPFLTRAF